MYAFHCMFPAFVTASQSKNGTTVEKNTLKLLSWHQLPHLMLMTATDHLSWWLLIFLPDIVMTAAEPPPPLTLSWQLLTPPPLDTCDSYRPLLLTLITMTDHPSWQLWQLQTTPSDIRDNYWPPPPPNMHNSYRPLLTLITMTTPIDNCDSYRPFLLTFMTMTDHPWHSWQQLATFRDIHGNNWPSLILMTISDLLSWHSWQVQTTPPDTHANYWPLFMTIYSEPWKIAGTVSIISCKLTLAVGDSCLCCCVHCYMADVCWVQLMGVVYWVLLIPFVSEFVLA